MFGRKKEINIIKNYNNKLITELEGKLGKTWKQIYESGNDINDSKNEDLYKEMCRIQQDIDKLQKENANLDEILIKAQEAEKATKQKAIEEKKTAKQKALEAKREKAKDKIKKGQTTLVKNDKKKKKIKDDLFFDKLTANHLTASIVAFSILAAGLIVNGLITRLLIPEWLKNNEKEKTITQDQNVKVKKEFTVTQTDIDALKAYFGDNSVKNANEVMSQVTNVLNYYFEIVKINVDANTSIDDINEIVNKLQLNNEEAKKTLVNYALAVKEFDNNNYQAAADFIYKFQVQTFNNGRLNYVEGLAAKSLMDMLLGTNIDLMQQFEVSSVYYPEDMVENPIVISKKFAEEKSMKVNDKVILSNEDGTEATYTVIAIDDINNDYEKIADMEVAAEEVKETVTLIDLSIAFDVKTNEYPLMDTLWINAEEDLRIGKGQVVETSANIDALVDEVAKLNNATSEADKEEVRAKISNIQKSLETNEFATTKAAFIDACVYLFNSALLCDSSKPLDLSPLMVSDQEKTTINELQSIQANNGATTEQLEQVTADSVQLAQQLNNNEDLTPRKAFDFAADVFKVSSSANTAKNAVEIGKVLSTAYQKIMQG